MAAHVEDGRTVKTRFRLLWPTDERSVQTNALRCAAQVREGVWGFVRRQQLFKPVAAFAEAEVGGD
jgi:hypothetical protein